MSALRTACAAIAWVLAVQAAGIARQPAPPELHFETVDAQPVEEPRLRRLDDDRLRDIVRLVGLARAGPPIRVVLAPEDSDLARATPSWIAGFANGASGIVVLFPARSLRYPHDSLEEVLRHEVAHVLIARAARGYAVPRWFSEGLAMAAERAWRFVDDRQLAWALVSAGQVSMTGVNDLFQDGPGGARQAYALAGAFVRHIIETEGSDAPARILAGVADGKSFDEAFAHATGRPLVDVERRFHADMTSWTRRLALLASPFFLWMMVTLLALYAAYVVRRRRIEQRSKWDEDDDEGEGSLGPVLGTREQLVRNGIGLLLEPGLNGVEPPVEVPPQRPGVPDGGNEDAADQREQAQEETQRDQPRHISFLDTARRKSG